MPLRWATSRSSGVLDVFEIVQHLEQLAGLFVLCHGHQRLFEIEHDSETEMLDAVGQRPHMMSIDPPSHGRLRDN